MQGLVDAIILLFAGRRLRTGSEQSNGDKTSTATANRVTDVEQIDSDLLERIQDDAKASTALATTTQSYIS